MRILYVGPLWYGCTCRQRMEAMKDLGHEVVPIDTEPEDVSKKQRLFLYRIIRKVFGPLDLAGVNQQIVSLINSEEKHFDIVWIDKGVTIKAETLIKIREICPKTILAHYNPDDPFGRKQGLEWIKFLKALSLYDIHFVPRKVNIIEYQNMGAKEVVQLIPTRGYSPNIHRPLPVSDQMRKRFGGPVGFIGDYEQERAELIFYLAENGIPIRVWGPNWDRRCKLSHPNLKIEGKSLWGDDYAKAICAFDINLGFLKKANRDLHTSRSIEIPACGAFMLAERTDEHLKLFEEGKEAEFFSTKKELLEKVRYYLEHEEERKHIARAGRERCLRSGYSYHERIKEMLTIVKDLREGDQ